MQTPDCPLWNVLLQTLWLSDSYWKFKFTSTFGFLCSLADLSIGLTLSYMYIHLLNKTWLRLWWDFSFVVEWSLTLCFFSSGWISNPFPQFYDADTSCRIYGKDSWGNAQVYHCLIYVKFDEYAQLFHPSAETLIFSNFELGHGLAASPPSYSSFGCIMREALYLWMLYIYLDNKF